MTKLSKIGLLYGAVLVVCAAPASMTSAASFAPIGTTHQLTSNNLGFTSEGPPALGGSCATSEFDADIVSASVIAITAARFQNCTGTLAAANCTLITGPTSLPWIATAPNTTNIQIHGIDIDVRFQGGSCALNGLTSTWTGTLTNGAFDPSSMGINRRVTFTNAPGLTSHASNGTSFSVFLNFSLRDPAGTINIFD